MFYSMLGVVYAVSYLPSGWLADRVAPRILISFSLYLTGALGFLYSTAPAFPVLIVIFGCWGVSTGLTFWSAVIKRVNSIATDSERGRFFGMLDGGRGLVEASLAFIAVSVFAYFTRNHSEFEGFRVPMGESRARFVESAQALLQGLEFHKSPQSWKHTKLA